MSPARTFTPHELATLTSAQVEALPSADRQAFFLASARATDPFYPFHLEGAGATVPCPTCNNTGKIKARNPNQAKAWEEPCPECWGQATIPKPIPLPDLSINRDLTHDLDPIASGRRFEIGE